MFYAFRKRNKFDLPFLRVRGIQIQTLKQKGFARLEPQLMSFNSTLINTAHRSTYVSGKDQLTLYSLPELAT